MGAATTQPFVVPDPDPVPMVGRRMGAATTQPFVVPDAAIRRAGPRSGTHGGAQDGRGYHSTLRRTGRRYSSCRTPIRYPRRGAGRGRLPPNPSSCRTPLFVVPDPDPVPTVGRRMGAATTQPFVVPDAAIRLAGLRSGTHDGPRASGTPEKTGKRWRRRADSNRRIEVLQTSALVHLATSPNSVSRYAATAIVSRSQSVVNIHTGPAGSGGQHLRIEIAANGPTGSLVANSGQLVPRVGFEPTRPFEHCALNAACLPISAPRPVVRFQVFDPPMQSPATAVNTSRTWVFGNTPGYLRPNE